VTVRRLAALILVAAVAAGCGRISEGGVPEERMPLPASIWLTSQPAEPSAPVQIEVTSPGDDRWSREHTFQPGEELIGSIPLGEGRYRLTALDGSCGIDLTLAGEREADLVLRLGTDGQCDFIQAAEHPYGAVRHDGFAVLVAPGSRP